MENASKALIVAGAILISIMIISLGVLMFNRMSASAKEAANMDEQEIASFNSKITPYVGDSISGSQVNALIQLVISIDNSAINTSSYEKKVSITYPINETTNNTIDIDVANSKLSGTDKVKKVETGSGKFYKVEATYGSNGLIASIKVTK